MRTSMSSLRPASWLAVLVATVALVSSARPAGLNARGSAAPTFTSAEECGRCHREIHRFWRSSMHAQATENYRFEDALDQVRATGKSHADGLCLQCHAPAAVAAQDLTLERKVSWEGVTCDFCHSVRSVSEHPTRPFVLDVGKVKTGPLKDAHPVGHQAAFADAHATALLCKPCHEYKNAFGLSVLSTYTEWQAYRTTRDESCVSCHMPATQGRVAEGKGVVPRREGINLHQMPGGHSPATLNQALSARITLSREGEQVIATVRVVNRGAGHFVPTGSPLRQVLMVVEAVAAGVRETRTKTYGRILADPSGRELRSEADVFASRFQELRDTRLSPGQERVERYAFQLPSSAVRASATFFYRYAPEAGAKPSATGPFLVVTAWLDAPRFVARPPT
jgi:Cytochrome c554 and c-prime